MTVEECALAASVVFSGLSSGLLAMLAETPSPLEGSAPAWDENRQFARAGSYGGGPDSSSKKSADAAPS